MLYFQLANNIKQAFCLFHTLPAVGWGVVRGENVLPSETQEVVANCCGADSDTTKFGVDANLASRT